MSENHGVTLMETDMIEIERILTPDEQPESEMKTVFEIIAEMHHDDLDNGTRYVQVSPSLISMDKVSGGAKISMGAPMSVMMDNMEGKNKILLLVLNAAEFEKRQGKSAER